MPACFHPPSIPTMLSLAFLCFLKLESSIILFQDIQIKGVNRDEKKIAMAKTYPNSRHFLTYQHSLRVKSTISCTAFGCEFLTHMNYLY